MVPVGIQAPEGTVSESSFGALVKAARERLKISQDELGQRVGVQRPQISKIESGERGPSFEVACRLAVVLDIDLRSVGAADLRAVSETISSEEPNPAPNTDLPPLVDEPSPQW